MKNKKILLTVMVIVMSFGTGFSYGRNSLPSQDIGQDLLGLVKGDKSVSEESVDFGTFWDVWDLLKATYSLGPLDEKKMVYGAISGMVDSLGDPYTVFLTPEENKDLESDLSGVFGGIGAEIGFKGGYITVITPLKESPAEKSGLLAGDRVMEVDGKDIEGLSVDGVVSLIRGEKGTAVKITVMRDEKYLDFEIVRDTIIDKTVKWEMKDSGVIYLEINQFKEDTAKELDDQIASILSQNPKGLVLDLRNNPGGYLDVVVDVASRFIKEGDTIVIEKSGDGKEQVYKAKGNQSFEGIPMVVLVNEGSASASEILAGALKDYKTATVVGKTTFGKGLVQGISSLDDGSALKVTVAEWMTPSGNNINKTGIFPDIEVDYTMDDYNADKDPQLDKALEILKK
jgi:carboxyl-terminal processing protease